MKIRTITTVIAILLLVIIPVQIVETPLNSSLQAASLSEIWTAVGSTVVVDETSSNKYQVNNGYIEFKDTKTGWIKARINLEMIDSTWNQWTVSYTDPDGAGNAYKVIVKIYSVKLFSPRIGRRELVRKINSNDFASTTTRRQQINNYFDPSWDNSNYAYYIEIDLYRSNTAHNVQLYSIQLYNVAT